MVKNVPPFRFLSDTIVRQICYLLRPKRYEAGQVIVQRGEEVDRIYLLKTGCIVVEVPQKTGNNHFNKSNLFLDWLNEGSCFCVYKGFNPEMYNLVNYKASSTCIVESILVKDLQALEKSNIELSDILSQMEVDILNGEKSDLDFFRFKPPRAQEIPANVKRLIRKKFKEAAFKYCK